MFSTSRGEPRTGKRVAAFRRQCVNDRVPAALDTGPKDAASSSVCASSARWLTHKHHEQAGVQHGGVEALAGGDKGGEGPGDEGDEEAPEDGFADPRVLQAQLLRGERVPAGEQPTASVPSL